MRTAAKILAIAYLAYLLIVALVVTPALNLVPSWYVKKYLGRDLDIKYVLFNPFNLSLHIKEAELPEHDGERFVGLASAEINLSVEGLWQPGWVFDTVAVDQLYVHVRQLSQDTFNFSDMIPASDEASEEPGGLPGITINNFDFNSEQVIFTDETREKHYSTLLDGLAIQVVDLSTVLEEGKPYSIDARGEEGGSLHWEGLVSIPGAHSEGSLALNDWRLPKLWGFIEPWASFEVKDGTASLEGRYSVDWGDVLAYQVHEGGFRLDQVAIQPKTANMPADSSVTLASLTIGGIELDGRAQHVAVESLTVDKLAIQGWSEGSNVSLVEMFALDMPEDDATAQDTGEDATPWTAELNTVTIRDNSLLWRSEFTEPALMEVSPIEATIQQVRWPLEGDTAIRLNLTVNGEATTAVEGSLGLAEGKGTLRYQLQKLPLPWFGPNLPTALKARLTDGTLGIDGEVALAQWAPVTIEMDGAVKNFAGHIEDTESALTSWDSVRWKQLSVDLEKRSVELASLSIDNYTGRLHIHKDGSINTQSLWTEELNDRAADESAEVADGAAEEEAAEEAGAEEADTPIDEAPWAVSVPSIIVTDSEIDFMDESLPIVFRTVIGDLNGQIAGLNSDPASQAKVDIKGSVDGYAPVKLTGTAAPLREPPAIDLVLTFDGIDMALLSPYSATYAGYAIDRGLLNLHLEYALQDGHLDGNNKVLIDKMKLGEKVESDKAADIPLELALSLLTDSNGVIDLQVPVSGDVGDPSFSIGSVVMGAFFNLITKAVTAPFTLLAGLVDSEEDLQRVNFASGSATLEQAAQTKLDQLSEALSQRPGLALVITGRLQLQADRERLQKNMLKAELTEAGLSQEELDSKGPEWETAISARFQQLTPGETQLSIHEQYMQLVQGIPVADEALLTLSRDRAAAVKAYLVNTKGLDPNRAVIEQDKLDDEANLYSGVELAVDT